MKKFDLSEHFNMLKSALHAIDTLTIPTELSAHNIEYDGPEFLKKNLRNAPKIYGFNTLPGHRVDESIPKADMVQFQFNLIANHRLGSGTMLDEETARSVTYAKLFAAATGHTLISRQLYQQILQAAANPDFKPEIPAHASYSAGDVIPAAHWAQSLLDWESNHEHIDPSLLPGEGMALINGGFVHVGVTLSLIRKLYDFWNLYIDTAEGSFQLLGADTRVLDEPSTPDKKWFQATMQHVKDSLEGVSRSSEVQDPVSIRTFPQQVQAVIFAIQNLMSEANAILSKPSGNPIMKKDDEGELQITPSGSFDQASLVLATSTVIEALMMLAWNSVRRTVHLLNGTHGHLPRDGATTDDPLGMIQWPKLAQASLERLRNKYGMHNFTSGSTTSEDIEDFWTNGTELALSAKELIEDVEKILMIERLTGKRLRKIMADDKEAEKVSLKDINEKTIAQAKLDIKAKDIPFPLKL